MYRFSSVLRKLNGNFILTPTVAITNFVSITVYYTAQCYDVPHPLSPPLDELPRDPPTSKPLPSHSPGVNEGEVALGDENDAEEGSGFHRRYAKRGMTFRPRTEGTPTNSSRGMLCVY